MVSEGLVLGSIVLAPLALGSVHLVTQAVVYSMAATALALALWRRLRAGERFLVTIPLVALLVAIGVSALQLVPVPDGVLQRISPAADETLTMALGDYGRHAVTIDVAATVTKLARLCAYACFFAVATMYASRSHRRQRLLFAIVIAATAVTVIGLVQAIVQPGVILGFYHPQATGESGFYARGTFANPNHFGGLLCLASPIALILARREARWRGPLLVAVILLNVGVITSMSRSSIVAAPLGQLAALLLERRSMAATEPTRASRRAFLLVAGVAAAALVLSVALSAKQLGAEVRRTEQGELASPTGVRSKVHLMEESAKLALAYRWVGHGAGAFEQAFPRVNDMGGLKRYMYVENGYLQAVCDWGVPVALLLTLLAVMSFSLALRRARLDGALVGALAGLCALALHEAADFSVEIPGVALPALAALATLFSRTQQPSAGTRSPRIRPYWLAAPAVAMAALVAALVMPTAAEEGDELRDLAHDPNVTVDTVLARGEAAARRHPADYFIATVVARRLAIEPRADLGPKTLRWLNRAMFLNPRYAVPHMLTAEILSANHYDKQALLEYRLAADGTVEPQRVWLNVLRHYTDADQLLAACPDDPVKLALLGDLLMTRRLAAQAEAVYQHALQLQPGDTYVRGKLVELALSQHNAAAAVGRARALVEMDDTPANRRTLVSALIGAGDLASAAKVAGELNDHSHESFRANAQVVQAFISAKQLDDARALLDQLDWAQDRSDLATIHDLRAQLEDRVGHRNQAAWERQQARQLRQ
jgi:hypothetical protein